MSDPKHRAQSIDCVPCAIVTVSDTRTVETDRSGAVIRRHIEAAGHSVCDYGVVQDEQELVRQCVTGYCDDPSCRAVLVNGGTGISSRDTTYEAVASLFDKRLDGFGELFRMLSYEDIGPAAMLSRAVAGVCGKTLVFLMPGSPGAVELAMAKLIIPQLGHMVAMLES